MDYFWREREAKLMLTWMLKVVFEENLVSEIGRACLIEFEWDGEIRDESEWGILEGRRRLWARPGGGKRGVKMRVFMEDRK